MDIPQLIIFKQVLIEDRKALRKLDKFGGGLLAKEFTKSLKKVNGYIKKGKDGVEMSHLLSKEIVWWVGREPVYRFYLATIKGIEGLAVLKRTEARIKIACIITRMTRFDGMIREF